MKPGKYGIYVYFLKNRTNQQKADYLKDAYGYVGAYPVIIGTGIDMLASSEGMRITKGETEILLKWGKVAKRIDEPDCRRAVYDRERNGVPAGV